MKVVITSKVSRSRSGKKGVRVALSTESGAIWPGIYSFDTHGLDETGVADKIDRVKAHHAKKEQILDEFEPLYADRLVVGGERFVIGDCVPRSIGDAGGDVELYVQVRRETGEALPRRWFPFTIVAKNLDEFPSRPDMREIIRARLGTMLADEEDDKQLLAKLRKLET